MGEKSNNIFTQFIQEFQTYVKYVAKLTYLKDSITSNEIFFQNTFNLIFFFKFIKASLFDEIVSNMATILSKKNFIST